MTDPADARELYAAAKNEDLSAELEQRGLVKTGNKDEMIERLVAHDAEQEPAVVAPADGEICAEHWPDGWPGDNVGATCEHGSWQRHAPEPAS